MAQRRWRLLLVQQILGGKTWQMWCNQISSTWQDLFLYTLYSFLPTCRSLLCFWKELTVCDFAEERQIEGSQLLHFSLLVDIFTRVIPTPLPHPHPEGSRCCEWPFKVLISAVTYFWPCHPESTYSMMVQYHKILYWIFQYHIINLIFSYSLIVTLALRRLTFACTMSVPKESLLQEASIMLLSLCKLSNNVRVRLI